MLGGGGTRNIIWRIRIHVDVDDKTVRIPILMVTLLKIQIVSCFLCDMPRKVITVHSPTHVQVF